MRARRLVTLAAIALAALPASAYYHYVHYQGRSGPFAPAYERFNVAALPQKTVTVSVDVSSMGTDYSGISPVLGQLRQAAAVWNGVSASELRIAFGGIKRNDVAAATPGIDVVFTNDLPPGFLAAAAPTVSETPATAADGTVYYPIVGSVMKLRPDVSRAPGPAYAETYFTTLVHELGHALGLQHTFTGSAMSQQVVRATTLAKPIEPDDVAALLTLYGPKGWAASYGSITGRVMMADQPVSGASVVALPPGGSPVSALTNPDGSYRIDGIPPGQCLLYVHPLPPTADITEPVDGAKELIPFSGPFETVFYPGTRDFSQITLINLKAGGVIEGRDFFVSPRAAVPVYDLITYSFYDSERDSYSWYGDPVTPAFLNVANSYPVGQVALVAMAKNGNTPAPVKAMVLAGLGESYYISTCCDQAALYFAAGVFTNPGSRHLVLNFQDDMYVLPNGVQLVAKNPPAITAVEPGSDGTLAVTGKNFGPASRVLFDGLEASVRSFDPEKGALTVTPPLGFSGQNAAMTVTNPDGQNSMTLDSYQLAKDLTLKFPPPRYAYPESEQPWLEVSPRTLPAGALAKIEITGHNLNFAEGKVAVGFGTGDVVIRRMWMLGPDRLLLNVSVAPDARTGGSDLSVISGFRIAAEPLGFQITAADSVAPAISAVANAVGTQATIYGGGYGAIYGSRLALPDATPQVALNGVAMKVEYWSPSQVTFAIPENFPTGPVTLTLTNGAAAALPVIIQVTSAPPSILSVTSFMGSVISPDRPVEMGDALRIVVSGLDPAAARDLSRLHVTLGDMKFDVFLTLELPEGLFELIVPLPTVPQTLTAPLAVWVDGSSSPARTVPVFPPPVSAWR